MTGTIAGRPVPAPDPKVISGWFVIRENSAGIRILGTPCNDREDAHLQASFVLKGWTVVGIACVVAEIEPVEGDHG